MEKINLNNYELYFIDYIDNKLSSSDMLELMAFLTENPNLENELNLAKEIKLKPELITFNKKNSLKKKYNNINREVFYELCIKKIENNITTNEEKVLNEQLNLHPELQKELNLFKLTLLKPDNTIVFSNKSALKRRTINLFNKTIFRISSVAVAAAILLLIFNQIFNFSINENKKNYANSKHIVKTNNLNNNFINNIKPNNKLFAVKKHNKIQNKLNINNKLLSKDTISNIAFVNNIKIIDSNITIIENIKLPQENSNKNIATFNNNTYNKSLDTTLNAIFKNSKYSHFSDMINNVPYELITASSNENFAMWDIIKASTNGINYITGSQIEVDNKIDEKKHVKRFSLRIGKIGFSRITHK